MTTLKRAITHWLVLQCIGKRPSTRHYYWEIAHTIRKSFRDCLAKSPEQITTADLARFAARLNHFSAPRWNCIVSVVRATIPAAAVLKRRRVKITRPPPPSQLEFSRLLAECATLKKSNAGLIVNFLAHTGLRIDEARRLQWSEVYPDHIKILSGKGDKPRAVPLVNGINQVLTELRQLDPVSPFVLPPGSIRTGLAKACRAAGVRKLTHHDFRHLFATRCIESGVDVPTVARWLGHSDGGALLARRYFHLLDEHGRNMARRVTI